MRPGILLLVLLSLAFLAVPLGREFFLHKEEPPAFFLERREGIALLLRSGFSGPGVHQFSDGITIGGVIKMTGLSTSSRLSGDPLLKAPLADGEALDLVIKDSQVTELRRFWMPASQRIALRIPLHPDHISLKDWQALPGIGPKLAQAIETDRQINGDFGSFEQLERVKGIGPKRIEGWKKFFQKP